MVLFGTREYTPEELNILNEKLGGVPYDTRLVYARDFPALPDGMAFDISGNMYVTLPAFVRDDGLTPANQVIAVDTDGNWRVFIDDSAQGQKLQFPTNCAFGGSNLQTLYIANLEGNHFSKVETPFVGHPLYHQR